MKAQCTSTPVLVRQCSGDAAVAGVTAGTAAGGGGGGGGDGRDGVSVPTTAVSTMECNARVESRRGDSSQLAAAAVRCESQIG